MPRKRRELASYPQAYLDIAEKAMKGEQIAPILQKDKKTAKATQLDLNRFRTALRDHGHPAFEAMRDLIITVGKYIEGDDAHVLEFTPRGLYKLAQELKGEEVLPTDSEGLPVFKPQPLPEDAERMIERMYGIQSNEMKEALRSEQKAEKVDLRELGTGPELPPCEKEGHDPDPSGSFCLKCKKPL